MQTSEKSLGIVANGEFLLRDRLMSLDVFRGITVALMILVNNPGGPVYYSALQHAEWNGWTLADLVFPSFLFIMGVAIPYSLGNRLAQGDDKKKLLLRIVRRSVILFVLGLFVNGFPYFDLSTLRIMGVLQRIALCYFFASTIFLSVKAKGQILLTGLSLTLYWVLMTLVPVLGYGAGVLTKEGNLAAYIDNLVLHGHLYAGTWDPEGLLSTLPAVATTLMGVLTGTYLRSDREPRKKTLLLPFLGGLFVAAGLLWDVWFPINKNLWTSSYAVFSGGIFMILLGACYYLVDVKKFTAWTKPFVAFGMNAITVYVFSEVFNLTLINMNVTLAYGSSIALKTFIYERYFVSWSGLLNGSLLFALANVVLCLGIAAFLYKLKIFIKV